MPKKIKRKQGRTL